MPSNKKLLDSIAVPEVDQDAFTVEEICKAKGMNRCAVEEIVRENVASGKWEKVRKKGRLRMQPAYRLKT